ncbi:MAG: hypothetical protein HDR41_01890 [Lactobacillus sp.]|nr:hypothetical protein [Lactobacillus sp.]
MDIFPAKNQNNVSNIWMSSLYAIKSYTSTQILSKKTVREIYHNMNRLNNIYEAMGIIGGLTKHSILGTIISLGG